MGVGSTIRTILTQPASFPARRQTIFGSMRISSAATFLRIISKPRKCCGGLFRRCCERFRSKARRLWSDGVGQVPDGRGCTRQSDRRSFVPLLPQSPTLERRALPQLLAPLLLSARHPQVNDLFTIELRNTPQGM